MTLAWHFCADRDGRPVYRYREPVRLRRWLRHEGQLVMCSSGFHASRRVLDALKYAPGPWLCRVKVDGIGQEDNDKLVAAKRMPLAIADVSRELHEFACRLAYNALLSSRRAGCEPPSESWAAVRVKLAWLRSAATDVELDGARRAAYQVTQDVRPSVHVDDRFAAFYSTFRSSPEAAQRTLFNARDHASVQARRRDVDDTFTKRAETLLTKLLPRTLTEVER